MRESLIAVVVALMLLYVLSRTQTGAKLFFVMRGSSPSSSSSSAGSSGIDPFDYGQVGVTG